MSDDQTNTTQRKSFSQKAIEFFFIVRRRDGRWVIDLNLLKEHRGTYFWRSLAICTAALFLMEPLRLHLGLEERSSAAAGLMLTLVLLISPFSAQVVGTFKLGCNPFSRNQK